MTEINQKWKIGNCQDLMSELDSDSIDLIVTDPPYGYSFMGKDWDKAVLPINIWEECLRILKPGAFAFIMSAPRQDVLAHNLVNLCDARFETGFTSIYWTFSSGFPKAGNIGKMVDKQTCKKSLIKKLGWNPTKKEFDDAWKTFRVIVGKDKHYGKKGCSIDIGGQEWDLTVASTPKTKKFDGSYSGFQPKPAVEIIMVVMKPLSGKTYIDQAMVNNKGITWLDDGRIPYQNGDNTYEMGVKRAKIPRVDINNNNFHVGKHKNQIVKTGMSSQGRFPANLLVNDDILNDGKERISKYAKSKQPLKDSIFIGSNYSEDRRNICNEFIGNSGSFSRYFDLDAWWDERVKQLPKEAQRTFPFMIVPKASKNEKTKDNIHPTVKPVKLFSWLITIGSRKNDLILDPFLGSGTTLEAGRFTDRRVIGFEISDEWEHLYSKRCMEYVPPLSNYI